MLLRDAVLEFSGRLAASVGLEKTSEATTAESCKFASVFMAASFKMASSGNFVARLPIARL